MTWFRDEQITLLASSGWIRCASVARATAGAGLAVPDADYLTDEFTGQQWEAAEHATSALREHFGGARFASEAVYGVLLVPDPAKLDTRQPMTAAVRSDQLVGATDDVYDERLPSGTLGINPGQDWTLVVTVTGSYGVSLGSYHDISAGPAEAFTVDGHDTRALMIRQIWGARVLQGGPYLPDCETNEHWTFSLFPGEPLTDAAAESGTVLKGKIRFRLGKPNRGIGPARVAPAIAIP